MSIFITTIMWIATVITGIMFLPQSYKTYKAKSVGDLSIISYSLVLAGTAGWVIWGAMGTSKGVEWGAFVANGAILIGAAPIVWYLYKPKHDLLPFIIYGIFALVFVVAIVLICMRSTMNSFMGSNGATLGTVWSIMSGCGTGFAFAPQTYKQVKNKSFVGVSMLTTSLIIACNFLWVVYYLLKTLYSVEIFGDVSEHMSVGKAILAFLPPIFFSAMSGSSQVIVLAAYLLNKKK